MGILSVKFSTLTTIAGGLGMGIGVFAVLSYRESNRVADRSPFVRKAVEIAQTQPTIKEILGSPIRAEPAVWDRKFHGKDKNEVKVLVPLRGDKEKGSVIVYAQRKDAKDWLRLKRIEMTFDNIKGKKLVLLDLQGDQTIDDGTVPTRTAQIERPDPKRFDNITGPLPKGTELKKHYQELPKSKIETKQ